MSLVVETPPHPAFLSGGGMLGALIRAKDWQATPLGAPETWPLALRSALSICLHSSFPAAIYWGPELRLLYNDAWAVIPADRHPWALGRPGAEVWPDIWEIVGPQFERVLLTGEGFSAFDQMLPMERGGVPSETYWNYSFTPIHDDDGVVVGVFNQGHETTDVVIARRNAEAEIQRLGAMFAQAPGGVAVLRGPTHVFEIVNPAYEELVGRSGLVGKSVAAGLPEVVSQGFIALLDDVYSKGEPYVGKAVPVVLERRPGEQEERFLNFVYQPLTDGAGQRSGIFVQVTDVTDATRSERALRESEEFSRSVVESSPDCITVLNLDGTIQFMNANGRALTEAGDIETLRGRPWISLWPDGARQLAEEAVAAALSGGVGQFSAFGPTATGAPKWWDVVVAPALGACGAPVRLVSVSRDVTEKRHAEEARQLLLGELNHRVKNLFAIASGMVAMTARNASSVPDMASVLRGRLDSLAKAHELIRSAIKPDLPDGDEGAGLEELVREILHPHLDPSVGGQFAIHGVPVPLGVKATTSLALVLHELATNAAKYGALCAASGRLIVRWTIENDSLALDWLEQGTAGSPGGGVREGFGSKLARATVTGQLGGAISYDWRADGVQIAIAAPLARLRV